MTPIMVRKIMNWKNDVFVVLFFKCSIFFLSRKIASFLIFSLRCLALALTISIRDTSTCDV